MTEEERQAPESRDLIVHEDDDPQADSMPDDELVGTRSASSAPDGDLTRQSFWGMVRRFFFKTRAERRAEQVWRIEQLGREIAHDSDAPVHYLLRGDLHLAQGQYHQAQHDLQRAYDLASEQLASAEWGLVAQSIRDQALRLLARVPAHITPDIDHDPDETEEQA